MTLVSGRRLLVVLSSLAIVGSAGATAEEMDLPPHLAQYAEWTALLDAPLAVPHALWIRCVAPTPEELDAARQTHGPHSERLIQVYANESATTALTASTPLALPSGSILAKEKRLTVDGTVVDGVAFMIKRSTPEFEDSGGWEFSYYPPGPDARATHEACAACHRAAASKDFVHGDYSH